MLRPRSASLAALLAGILLAGTYAVVRRTAPHEAPSPPPESPRFTVAELGDPRAQASTQGDACAGCHAREVAAWRTSQHAKAQRPFSREADPKPPGAPRDPVAMIGVAPLEQALLAGDRGRVQVFDPAFDRSKNAWFSIFGANVPKPHEWGHWSRGGMTWNAQCAACHTTDLAKGYRPEEDRYDTRFRAVGVACAACHGERDAPAAGEAHHTGATPKATEITTAPCNACHGRREELTGNFHFGERFSSHYRLLGGAEPGLYWPDGQARDEVFEAGSLAASRMGHAGVTCLDCHEPHGGALRAPVENDALCMGCHGAPTQRGAIVIDRARHGRHAPGAGVRCVDCHMPQNTVMERDRRRDHRFASPDPLLTRDFAIPNACAACHGDRGNAWTLAAVEGGWGSPAKRPAHTRARLLARAEGGDAGAVGELAALVPREENAYWREAILDRLARFPQEESARNALLAALRDPAEGPRQCAVRALARFPEAREALVAMRSDASLAVRLAAAWATRSTLPHEGALHAEVVTWVAAAHDTPAGAMRASELAVVEGRHDEAIRWASRAVAWDPSTPTYGTLARAYAVAGRKTEANQALAEAQRRAANPSR